MESLRNSILTFVVARFAPSHTIVEEVEQTLRAIDNTTILQMLIADVARADDAKTFLVSLRKMAGV